MTGSVRVLAAGVDSLYASVPDGLTVDTLAEAINHRAMAQDAADTDVWQIPGSEHSFETLPHGFGKYVACLRSPAMQVRVGPEDEHRPALLIEWRSTYLHRAGVLVAVEEAEQIVAYFCPHLVTEVGPVPPRPAGRLRIESDGYPGRGLTVSRLDIYCDTQGWAPDLIQPERFVTRATHRRCREETRDIHREGLVVSNLVFGSGELMCRIYNKTRLMAKKGETWQREVWRGYDPDHPVWRIEFQFRRGALRDFHIDGEHVHSVADALAVRQGLWEYAMDWLSLRDPAEDDSNRSRWPVSGLWEELRAVEVGVPCAELVRKRVRDADEARLVALFTGCASSLAARGYGRQLPETLHRALPAAERHLRKKGRSFEQIAAHKRERSLAV